MTLLSAGGSLAFFDETISSFYETELSKEEFLDAFVPLASKKILAFNKHNNSAHALKTLQKKAKDYMTETGIGVLFAAFGFLNYADKGEARTLKAPILLVGVSLRQESIFDEYKIMATSDEVILNPTLQHKLKTEFNLTLPSYEDEGLQEYLQKLNEVVAKSGFSVSCECRLGIFSFAKINMYNDLMQNSEQILACENILSLLGEKGGKQEPPQSFFESKGEQRAALMALNNVVDADSSQMQAVLFARSGKSFVLQGPPGTGKSQTITNIIAELLSQGKKVLFVSEKQAALNVVYEKLKAASLADFTLPLHSHKANKKDLLDNIVKTLNKPRTTPNSKAAVELRAKQNALSLLDAYAEELHRYYECYGKSLYGIYNELSRVGGTFELATQCDFGSKSEEFLQECEEAFERYAQASLRFGYDYKTHPFYSLKWEDFSHTGKARFRKFLQLTSEYCDKVLEVLGSALLEEMCLLQSKIERFEEKLDFVAALGEFSDALKENLLEEDAKALHATLSRQFSNPFVRFFSAKYNRLVTNLNKHSHIPLRFKEACELCLKAGEFDAKVRVFKQNVLSFRQQIGSNEEVAYARKIVKLLKSNLIFTKQNWTSYSQNAAEFAKILDKICEFEELLKKTLELKNIFGGEFAANQKALKITTLSEELQENVKLINKHFCDEVTQDAQKLKNRCEELLENFEQLDEYRRFWTLVEQFERLGVTKVLDELIAQGISAREFGVAFKRAVLKQQAFNIINRVKVLAEFERFSHDKLVETFAQKDKLHLKLNKQNIAAMLSRARPNTDYTQAGSKLARLLREAEKKRRQMAIRELFANFGELILEIKPCLLMSPLSVSTFLHSQTQFDAVIFDEASQIFVQDAVVAIYRAKQCIIVGDSKQMPPSNFFNTSAQDEEEEEDVGDFESVLDLATASFAQIGLKWHYRSRFESLIAFSNKNFYDNLLVTFPSPVADEKGIGVDFSLCNGVFNRKSKTNEQEAQKVVELIYWHIANHPEQSLGVIAFSIAQQELIEQRLLQKRAQRPECEFFFKEERQEPFFVKNLETAQGDERDRIIFSVAYGFDENGRFLHNFGPLNRQGGERRLNVAVTRAKINIILVASFCHNEIDLSRTNSVGVRLLKEYLDYAQNGYTALKKTLSVGGGDSFDSEFEMEVCEFLRENGYKVDTQIGCAGFKIDLGLRDEKSGDYFLAVECDGDTYHRGKNARDRDRLRQEILERMGWRFYRIWSSEWFFNKKAEQQRLLEAAAKAAEEYEIGRLAKSVARQTPEPESGGFSELDVLSELGESVELSGLDELGDLDESGELGVARDEAKERETAVQTSSAKLPSIAAKSVKKPNGVEAEDILRHLPMRYFKRAVFSDNASELEDAMQTLLERTGGLDLQLLLNAYEMQPHASEVRERLTACKNIVIDDEVVWLR